MVTEFVTILQRIVINRGTRQGNKGQNPVILHRKDGDSGYFLLFTFQKLQKSYKVTTKRVDKQAAGGYNDRQENGKANWRGPARARLKNKKL